MPNYLEFQKSISRELIAVKDRVRNFIGHQHWGEDGHYKESVLMQTLRNYLPDTVRVGTGFVIRGEQCSTQIDIIIYLATVTPFFKSGDFIIIDKNGVKGIIEVKTRLDKNDISDVIRKAHENGELIGSSIFNGIFAYESDLCAEDGHLPPAAKSALEQHKGRVNNVAFGANIFMKYWLRDGLRQNSSEHISFYDLPDLAFGYFISNLAEDVSGIIQSEERQRYYYPVESGKETRRMPELEITFNAERGNRNANPNRR
jgi:hypothetical protein